MSNLIVYILFPILTAHILGWHAFLWEDEMNIELFSVKNTRNTFFFAGVEKTSNAYLWKKVLNSPWSDLVRSRLLPRFVYALLVILRPSLHLYILNRPLRL
jgi:hypothetical protein